MCAPTSAAEYWIARSSRAMMSREDFSNSKNRSRGRFCPSCALNLAPQIKRAQGKPDAGRIRWPCVQSEIEMHTSFSHHRRSRTSGFPCTTDNTAYSALSPGHCPPSLHRTPCGSSPGRMTLPSCNLSTSLGCQDHTTSPSASRIVRHARRLRSLHGHRWRPPHDHS